LNFFFFATVHEECKIVKAPKEMIRHSFRMCFAIYLPAFYVFFRPVWMSITRYILQFIIALVQGGLAQIYFMKYLKNVSML